MSADQAQLAAIKSHFLAGRLDQARAAAMRLVQKSPGNAEANNSCATVLYHTGDRERAMYYARRAAELEPREGAYRATVANLLIAAGKPDEAISEFLSAEALQPEEAGHALALVPLYWERGEHDLALAAARRGMAADAAAAVGPLASVLMNIGEFEEAVRVLRTRLAVEPGDAAALGSLAMAMNYLPGVRADEVADVHRRFGAAMSAGVGSSPARREAREGPLKIGFLSPDLYEHSVAAFLEPILAHRDAGRIRTVCYSTRSRQDDTTRRLMTLANEWRDVAGRGDTAVAAQIRADGVDILIDLAGLTGMAELRVMARRPAPVQMTAIGYPNTTGMAAIGYRLVDEVTDPPGSEAMATETLVRVAGCFLCFQPPADAPDAATAPCGRDGPVTFGTFNNCTKVSHQVMAAWAGIMKAAPGSRLIIKSRQFECASVRERYAERLIAAGILRESVELLPPTGGRPEHLATYGKIDIALDTFPYNGTTTTCEALWMGVPVVAVAGDRHASRVGASLLSAAGLGELVGGSVDEYITIAAGLAKDRPRLALMRAGLREQVRSSSLCDGPGYARRWGEALRAVWERNQAR